ncbi:MAG: hypothetical protein R2882_02885 [Gemmatimonadales bacterium]
MKPSDEIPENLALVTKAGVRAVLHTDSPDGIQRMNQDAAVDVCRIIGPGFR